MRREVIERKLRFLSSYVEELEKYLPKSREERSGQHFAIERLLQLLCEASSDISLQLLKAQVLSPPPETHRAVFAAAAKHLSMPLPLAEELGLACGMRNVIVHMYDELDMDKIMAAVDLAPGLYKRFGAWVLDQLDQLDRPPA
ncbi:MAG: DUF86 domain-containing protein [Rhodocyclaceae bacterium]|nr:DUF86 domain-containing protein [Rhodocyclaceae bacterium]